MSVPIYRTAEWVHISALIRIVQRTGCDGLVLQASDGRPISGQRNILRQLEEGAGV